MCAWHACSARLPLLVLLLAVCSSSSAVVHAQPLEVVQLTPLNLEHETQAATGQTTGHWFVLVVNSSASSGLQAASERAWKQLAADEDKATILARVDLADAGGPALAKRFSLTATPAALLLRDRGLYRLNLAAAAASGSTDGSTDGLTAAVHAFMDGGYEHEAPSPVPKEEGLLDVVLSAASALSVSPTPMLWAGIACMAVGALLFLGMIVVGVWYMYSPDTPSPAAAAAPKAKAAAGSSSSKPSEQAPAAGEAAAGEEPQEEEDDDVLTATGTRASTRARRRA